MFNIKKESILRPFKSYLVTTSIEIIFLTSGIDGWIFMEPSTTKRACYDPILIFKFFIFFFNNWFLSILVLKSGDIELDPESSKTSPSYFSCCHWSVNSLPADNYIEVAGLKVYHSIYKYYFICVRESFPN